MRSGQKNKKIKEKVIVAEQPEFESEDKEFLVGFDSEEEPVMLKNVQHCNRRLTLWCAKKKWHPQKSSK